MSQVERNAAILSLVPEGTHVQTGDLVCVFDSSLIRDRLRDQEILTEESRARIEQAKKTLEVAEVAVREYLEGIYPAEEQALEGKLKIAETELEIVKRKVEHLRKPGNNAAVDAEALLDLLRAEFAQREAATNLKVLREYAKVRRHHGLQAEVEKSRSEVYAVERLFNLAKEKQTRLQDQLDKHKLIATCSGVVRWANPPDRPHRIEVGAVVRQRQPVVEIVPDNPEAPDR